jgi:hypothetical protein
LTQLNTPDSQALGPTHSGYLAQSAVK